MALNWKRYIKSDAPLTGREVIALVEPLTPVQRVYFAILCGQFVFGGNRPVWDRWAGRWVSGKDGSCKSAAEAFADSKAFMIHSSQHRPAEHYSSDIASSASACAFMVGRGMTDGHVLSAGAGREALNWNLNAPKAAGQIDLELVVRQCQTDVKADVELPSAEGDIGVTGGRMVWMWQQRWIWSKMLRGM